ncbi:MAG: glutamate 5-kinase [Pseudomonadota bacterium]
MPDNTTPDAQRDCNTHAGSALRGARRLVIKIGSALLVDPASGQLNRQWLESLAQDIAWLRGNDCQVIVVSSGAIALGRRYLSLSRRVLRLDESQAAAAAGQVRLAHAFQEVLDNEQLHVAQILLTLEDTERRPRYLNARNTMNTLLGMGVVPVVNENDTVATSEIRYGDNDRLAARVAQMAGADCLVLLSDIDGLYTGDPSTTANAKPIPLVERITSDIKALAGDTRSDYGTGGMATKVAAADIAAAAGCTTIIASGRAANPVRAVSDGTRCTLFASRGTPVRARKQWIAASLHTPGRLIVDAGAAAALAAGKSLLPAGVQQVEGDFSAGDTVMIVDTEGTTIGRGLCAYSRGDAARIAGRHSDSIAEVLGFLGREEMIHRDDLVLADTP